MRGRDERDEKWRQQVGRVSIRLADLEIINSCRCPFFDTFITNIPPQLQSYAYSDWPFLLDTGSTTKCSTNSPLFAFVMKTSPLAHSFRCNADNSTRLKWHALTVTAFASLSLAANIPAKRMPVAS